MRPFFADWTSRNADQKHDKINNKPKQDCCLIVSVILTFFSQVDHSNEYEIRDHKLKTSNLVLL